jgi:hypothetical protein
MSKKELTMSVYAELTASGSAKLARKDVLSALSTRVGISKACASTYLSNICSGKWTSEPKAAKVAKVAKSPKTPSGATKHRGLTIDDVTAMSNKDLVAAYNKKAAKPVVKFRDHATGLKRVLDLYGMNA